MDIHFNPRSPHRERLDLGTGAEMFDGISIHAPLTGSDNFLPYHPRYKPISIHAPLTGSDVERHHPACQFRYFNPRSPHRERLIAQEVLTAIGDISIHAPLTGSDFSGTPSSAGNGVFQSTLPSQGATMKTL